MDRDPLTWASNAGESEKKIAIVDHYPGFISEMVEDMAIVTTVRQKELIRSIKWYHFQ